MAAFDTSSACSRQGGGDGRLSGPRACSSHRLKKKQNFETPTTFNWAQVSKGGTNGSLPTQHEARPSSHPSTPGGHGERGSWPDHHLWERKRLNKRKTGESSALCQQASWHHYKVLNSQICPTWSWSEPPPRLQLLTHTTSSTATVTWRPARTPHGPFSEALREHALVQALGRRPTEQYTPKCWSSPHEQPRPTWAAQQPPGQHKPYP